MEYITSKIGLSGLKFVVLSVDRCGMTEDNPKE